MSINTKKIIFGISVLFVIFCLTQLKSTDHHTESSTLQKIKKEQVLRVGYVTYPPYVIKDVKSEKLTGYYVDILNEIASRSKWKIEWVESSWQTYISDLKTGKFDVLGDPIFIFIPRLQEVSFTTPINYINDTSALVRGSDYRFSKLEDINKNGVVVSVHLGDTAQSFVEKNLPEASVKVFSDDALTMGIIDVVSGNSDVVFGSETEQRLYIKKNPTKNVKILDLGNSVSPAPAAWAIKQGDIEWLLFLNGSLQVMKDDGTLRLLAKKYHLYSYEIEGKFIRR